MKRYIRLFALCVFMVVSIRSTCKTMCYTPQRLRDKPKEVIRFEDYVYYHNMSITYDGKHYYTINGGNEARCVINEYDEKGNVVDTYDVGLDGRSILYNPQDRTLYVKVYGTDLYSVNLTDESAEIVLVNVFKDDNSSVGISADGKELYELVNGVVRVIDVTTGEERRTFAVKDYHDVHGYQNNIAVCKYYCHIWGAEDKILVYKLDGAYTATLQLPRPGYGFSLSFCNKKLWVAEDADAADDGGNGEWYGYKIQ